MNEVPVPIDSRRDEHLFDKRRPKKLLALDGGGVRGAITVAFLERIEKILTVDLNKPSTAGGETSQQGLRPERPNQQHLKEETPRPFEGSAAPRKTARLGDFFDLVGGTSTGAIIACALALGHTTAEIKDFYLRLAPRVFRRPLWRVPFLQAKFDARALTKEIDDIVKDRTLDSPDLITGLGIIMKRLDTGSPWILLNNKRAPYWNDRPGVIGNKHYKLAHLIRASTAAPHYFDPEILPIMEGAADGPFGNINANLTNLPILSFLLSKVRALYFASKSESDREKRGLFVDGGVTPYNSPAFALLMHTTLRRLGICWDLHPEKLTIYSVGTGTYRARFSFAEIGRAAPLRVVLGALLSLMTDTETLALIQMQWLGECLRSWKINSEIEDLYGEAPPMGKLFRFARYDLKLEKDWLLDELDVRLDDKEVALLRRMDDPGIIETIYALARLAAEKQVEPDHLFQPPADGLAPWRHSTVPDLQVMPVTAQGGSQRH
jgi:uncharacterized protein